VADVWTSHCEFEGFREKYQAEVERFNVLISSEGLVVKQELVGTCYRSDEGDDGLVSTES
jgi:hypothetical protein